MILMSYNCQLVELKEKIKWLEEELGATIFKMQSNLVQSTHPPEDEFLFSNKQILFYVMDPEFETMIALKYPPGTFRKHNI